MSAQPIAEHDPDDPVEILRVLPERYHDQFLAQYQAAARDAQRVEGYRALHELLRFWRLRAITYADPGYDQARAAVQSDDPPGSVPIEDVVPGWAKRLRRRQ